MQGDLLILQKSSCHEGEVLYPPGPSSLLFILHGHGAPDVAGVSNIHENGNIQGNHAVISIIMQEALPIYHGVIGDHVRRPIINLNQSLKAHDVAGEGNELLKTHTFGHLAE